MKKSLLATLVICACGNSSGTPVAGQGGSRPSPDAALAGSGGAPAAGGATGASLGGSAASSPIIAAGGAQGVGGSPTTMGGETTAGGTVAAAGGRAGGATIAQAAGGAGSGDAGLTAGGKTGGSGNDAAPGAGGKTGDGAGASGAGGSPDARASAGSGGAGTGTSAGSAAWSAGPAESKPVGYGQHTTGAGTATVVQVASMAALQAAIDAYAGSGGLSLAYTGKFDFSTIPDPCTQYTLPAQTVEIKKKSDITLMGADGSAANFGIHIASSSSNIIVRNMTFGLLPGGSNADAISLEGMSGGFPTNVWIDHNELFSSMADCAGAGDSSFDGLIDVKKGADAVTVSYNYLHDHHKVSLNGYSDSDTAVRHITFHHNVFENVGSRTPLQRGGYSHLFNNYLHKITTSGANIRMGGYSLIEANYFDTVENPVTARDSSAIGFWDLRNNNVTGPTDFATYAITWVASTSQPSADATDWKTSAAFPEPLGYDYSVSPAACVKAGLGSVAGSGKGLATLVCK